MFLIESNPGLPNYFEQLIILNIFLQIYLSLDIKPILLTTALLENSRDKWAYNLEDRIWFSQNNANHQNCKRDEKHHILHSKNHNFYHMGADTLMQKPR